MPSSSSLESHTNHPHNAHCFEIVTVYYRWHPFFGLSLPVHKRRKTRSSGERVCCQLPDGTLCSVPSWMLRPECAHFSFGAPLISVEALSEVRHLLTAWQTPATCGKPLLKSPAKEGGDETISEATQAADESATFQRARDQSSQPQAKGTGAYAHGTTRQRGPRKQSRTTNQRRKR
jgi:hypothetical protein